MAQHIPILFNEVLNLVNPPLSLPAENIKFGSCSLESDKHLTVCETSLQSLAIVEMKSVSGSVTATVTRTKMSAEAAIMNPVSRIIALRAGNILEIVSLEHRMTIKTHTLSEPVVFWKWISSNIIAVVTLQSVWHWNIERDACPVKVFYRNATLGIGTQIINYQVSGDGKWCLLCGISAGSSPGVINGNMQVYSIEKTTSQLLQGHYGVFTTIKVPGRENPAQILSFFDKKPDGTPPKLCILEVGHHKTAPGSMFRVEAQNIPFTPDAANDFPVAMNTNKEQGLLYMMTKMGYLFLFDIFSGKTLYRARITPDVIFATTEHTATNGILCITRKGQLLGVSVSETAFVPYIANVLRDPQLAMDLASRLNLPGAEELFLSRFQQSLAAGDIVSAARVAADSPRGFLRTMQTIRQFQAMPVHPGKPQPVFEYFSILLEKGKLNKFESIEFARPLVQQGRASILDRWIAKDKVELSAELNILIHASDLVHRDDLISAYYVYIKSKMAFPDMIINWFMRNGEFDKIAAFSLAHHEGVGLQYVFKQIALSNPAAALDIAKELIYTQSEGGNSLDANSIVELFMSAGALKEATAFLLEILKGDREEDGFLQTKLLEINLLGGAPQVADAMLANKMYSHYDRVYIGRLCEKNGLPHCALKNYSDINDIKRVLLTHPGALPLDFVIRFFGRLSKESSLEILKELLMSNNLQNIHTVVQVATNRSEVLGPENLINLFEDVECFHGLLHYLASIVNFSQVPMVHQKYIEVAARLKEFEEVERMCRDSTFYDPQEVLKFLMEAKLSDPRPLIHVCERFDFVEELTEYMYSNALEKYIEVYVQKVSPEKMPRVVGKLLDLGCDEELLRSLLSAGQTCSAEELIKEVERRDRLPLLQSWLEARVAKGDTDTCVHNAIGKIYIMLDMAFLTGKKFYDPKVLGAYCEKFFPDLASLAFKRDHATRDESGKEEDPFSDLFSFGAFQSFENNTHNHFSVESEADSTSSHTQQRESEQDDGVNRDEDPLASSPPTHDFSVSERDHYLVLGVTQTASKEDIEQAFNALKQIFHPELSNAVDAKMKYERLLLAFEVLGDEINRKAFNNCFARSYKATCENDVLPMYGHAFTHTENNHYAVLGVHRDCAMSTIEAAFRRLRKRNHPDVNNAANAVEMYNRLKLAYDTLRDEESRRAFDEQWERDAEREKLMNDDPFHEQDKPSSSEAPEVKDEEHLLKLPKYNHCIDLKCPNHYTVLGVHEKASQETIAAAFRMLRQRYHPDLSKDPNAVAKYERLKEAFAVLGDEESRRSYDDALQLKSCPDSNKVCHKWWQQSHDFSLTETDYYAVLGVSPDCTKQEMKKAYISLSLRIHPDKNPAPDAKEKFQKLWMAFSTLYDENGRMDYDLKRKR